MQKPITLVREDFINALVTLINTSPLPMFAVEPILRQYADAVAVSAKQQLELDRQNYLNSQKEAIENTEENKVTENTTEDNNAEA